MINEFFLLCTWNVLFHCIGKGDYVTDTISHSRGAQNRAVHDFNPGQTKLRESFLSHAFHYLVFSVNQEVSSAPHLLGLGSKLGTNIKKV